MTCRIIESDCKRSSERRQRGFDLTNFCARFWAPGFSFTLGVVTRPKPRALGGKRGSNGYEFIVTNAGQSGETEPQWTNQPGSTVIDGGVVWTCQDISNDSLERVITSAGDVSWIAPTGMTVDDPDVINTNGTQQIVAFHDEGVDGEEYLVIGRVTFSDGSVEDFGINWLIDDLATEDA